MKRLLALVLTTSLMWSMSGGGVARAKPMTVFEDAAGDAGNQDSGIPGFDQAGLDLVGGSIDKKGKNLIFTITHAAMPATGTLPELSRFLWHFNVDGEEYRFTVKSFDVGKPDVIAGSGNERVGQVYTNGVYRLEACTQTPLPAVLTLNNCNAIEYLEGEFDPAAKTATWTLPLKSVKAKRGSIITQGTTSAAASGCPICWVVHYAERSLTPHTVIDSAVQSVEYKVK